MSWLRIDDKFPRHRKVVPLSDAAFRLHVTAMSHAAEHGTDGEITEIDLRTMPSIATGKKLKVTIRELEEQGIWEREGANWRIHDFLDWNPSASEQKAKQDAARERMRRKRSRDVRANTPRTDPEDTANFARSSPTPYPSRPVPVPILPVDDDPGTCQVTRPPDRSTGSSSTQASAPGNLEDALLLTISERAAIVERDPHRADYLEPNRWPEVVKVAESWGDARLGQYGRDAGVRAVVALFAAGFSAEELVRVSKSMQSGSWAQQQRAAGKRPGMASLRLESVRRELESTPVEPETRNRDPKTARRIAATQAAIKRANEERRAALLAKASSGPPAGAEEARQQLSNITRRIGQ